MGLFGNVNRKAEITTTITENAKTTRARLEPEMNPAFKNNYTVLAGNNCPDTCPEYPRVVVLIPPPVDPGRCPDKHQYHHNQYR